jgi:hypothetical protein
MGFRLLDTTMSFVRCAHIMAKMTQDPELEL